MTQSGPLQPCRELFCAGAAYDLHVSSSRFPYLPPMLLVPPMLMDAADHRLLYYIVSWHSPHH